MEVMLGAFVLATIVGWLAIGCNAVGMTFDFDPDGPLGWLSRGLITISVGIFVLGLTAPLWSIP